MRKGLKIFLIILAVVVVLVAAGAIIMTNATKNLENLADISIADVDLSAIPDGTYSGSYSAFPVAAEVEVTVRGGAITAVDLTKHDNGKGKDAEAIPSMVVGAQSLHVDMVTGATYSSKVILLAIEDALKSAGG